MNLPTTLPEPEIRTVEDVSAAYAAADIYFEDADFEGVRAFYVYRFDLPDSPDPYEAGLVVEDRTDGRWIVREGRGEYEFDTLDEAAENVRQFAVREGYMIEPSEVYRDALCDVIASAFFYYTVPNDDRRLFAGIAPDTPLQDAVDPKTAALIDSLLPRIMATKASREG